MNRSAGRVVKPIWGVGSFSDAEARIAAQEAQLVAQVAEGNIEEPMKELYGRYAKNLYRFGVHMLGEEGLALEDLTQSQIAERLSLPLGTVKTRTFHGMRALRSVLGERGFSAA